MKWVAECHLCGAKQRVPAMYPFMVDAKKWASAWEDQHIEKEHKNVDTEQA